MITDRLLNIALRPFMLVFALMLLASMSAASVKGQSEMPVYNGDVTQQRLLIRVTSHYLHTISQGQIDMDSAVRIPCKVYGLSPLLNYNEAYSDGKPSAGTRLLDAGRVKEAGLLLASLNGEARLRLLIELGAYFIFKPGTDGKDLGEASRYVTEAIVLSEHHADKWKIESLTLQGFLRHQLGQHNDSQEVFQRIITLCGQTQNESARAQALLNAARLLHYGHPARLESFEKARSIFRTLGAKDKEVETTSEITIEHFVFKRYEEAGKATLQTLALLQELNHRHLQYTYDALAYISHMLGRYPDAIAYSTKSFKCLESAHDSVFISYFHHRIGVLYTNLDKYDMAMDSYDKALANRTHETRLYWFKTVPARARLLNQLHKYEELIAFLDEIESEFPPVTIFETMHIALMRGEGYERLTKWNLAEKHYNIFLSRAQNFPVQYVQSEFSEAYSRVAFFYMATGKIQKARETLDHIKSLALNSGNTAKADYYTYLFKIDSADGQYKNAIRHLQLSRQYVDSAHSNEQRKKTEELLVQYEAEKKDKDIQLLKQRNDLQTATLKQSQFAQRITIIGAALLLLIVALLYYLYRTKQKSNTQLKSLVNEKEWLLKEVHHRVKNNLQTVLSLLESQSRQLSNEALHAIQESQNRVYAMSLIHKKLYQSTDVASIDMEDYLRDLVQHLRDSFGQSGAIRFDLRLDPVSLDVSQAVPVGLIVNEAITNALKYAFPEKNRSNQISIALTAANHNIELAVSDNGVGMIGADPQATNSLGLKLMRGLTEDIDGFFAIDTQNGVSIRIRFVPSAPLQRNDVEALSTR